MFVSHINTFLDGGAATAARRLHEELRREGTDSRYYYARQLGSRDELDASYQPARWRRIGLNQQIASAIQYRIHRASFKRNTRNRPSDCEVFTSPRARHTHWPPLGHPSDARDSTSEIVHLHWIAKFVDYDSFFGSLSPQQPVVWTLHDMNAFTGGCHFSSGCDRFRSGCGHCPQLRSQSAGDISRNSFLQKQAALSGRNLNVAAPSRWLLEAARSSPMFNEATSFTHIPYGISTRDYYPMDREEARARLGIDPSAKVVCFGAMDLNNRRKGTHHLLRALTAIADLPDVQAIVFGSGQLPKTSMPLPSILQVGPIHGLLQQRTVYSASDVFVLPSLEDNLPLTGLEAMACGTPIVGFAAGGIPEYVIPNKTGLLAPVGDAEQLGRQLRKMMTQPALAESTGRRARKAIEDGFTAQREASAYQQLYSSLSESLLDESPRPISYRMDSYHRDSGENVPDRRRRHAA